MKEIKEFM